MMNFQKSMKTTNVSIQAIKAKVDHLQYVSNAIQEQKKAKKKSDLDSAGRAGAWSGGDFWAVSGAETGNFRK